MFTLIENGTVYTPTFKGIQPILFDQEKILHIGPLPYSQNSLSDLGCRVIDATDCIITPGFIDPHNHLIGAAGEQGFITRMPEVPLADLICAGITTVVGCLGTDIITRNLTTLLAKVRQLEAQGLSAYMYTGGFPLPTPTLTSSVGEDLVLIDKVIGVGEIAIADARSSHPTLLELARLISEARVSGKIAGKAGITHFHVGPSSKKLSVIIDLLEQYDVDPSGIHLTHVQRSKALLDDAIALSQKGVYVDTDVIDQDVADTFTYYLTHGGIASQFTVSSDAHTKNAHCETFYQEFVNLVCKHQIPIETVLPCFTQNTARALHLSQKGVLEKGNDADLLVFSKKDVALQYVFAKGQALLWKGHFLHK